MEIRFFNNENKLHREKGLGFINLNSIWYCYKHKWLNIDNIKVINNKKLYKFKNKYYKLNELKNIFN